MATIKEFFEARGSVTILAKSMGSTVQAVSLWTSGKKMPTVSSIIKLSKALTELGVEATPAQVLSYCNEAHKKYEETA